ncbi:hypothetical protein ACSU1N_02955 [Thermogladius sp. 4427co]|uniref:hypothetical protein n=1 Tax=Thermogladius sp. 4427co TaxID=3450718 RepID=UPI003F7A0365
MKRFLTGWYIILLLLALTAIGLPYIPRTLSQEICLQAIYMTTSSLIGFFNGSDLYLWKPYVEVTGMILNYNNIGGLLNITFVYNGVIVGDSFTSPLIPNSTHDFYLSANLSSLGVREVSTYSIIVSLRDLKDGSLIYLCTLVSGRVYISGYNWGTSLWSNKTTGNVTVSVMPSIITNNINSQPRIYLYAKGLPPFRIYQIQAIYPNIPNTPLDLGVAGSGASGDLYTTLNLPVVTNTSEITISLRDIETGASYNTTIQQVLTVPPPKTCTSGQQIISPAGPLITPTTATPTTTSTPTPVTVTSTITTTLTTTIINNRTLVYTTTLYINNTVTTTVTLTSTHTSTITQEVVLTHNSTSTVTQTLTVTNTTTIENPVLSQLSRGAIALSNVGYIAIIGFLALTAATAASISIIVHRPLSRAVKTFRSIEERLKHMREK